METSELFVSRDVVFVENVFPYIQKDRDEQWKTGNNVVDDCLAEEESEYYYRMPEQEKGDEQIQNVIEPNGTTQEHDVTVTMGGVTEAEQDQQPKELLGQGHREKRGSVLLRDFVLHTVKVMSPSANSLGHRHSSGSPYPIAQYVNCDKFSMHHRAFLAAITTGVEPKSFAEAVKDERWRDAMKKEIQALEDNGTWTVKLLPSGKRSTLR